MSAASAWPTLHTLPGPRGRVAVTIDDGPNPDTTLALLDVLEAYGAKANFFACGINAEKFPELCARIVAAGHGLFSHCYDHRALDTLTDAEIVDQLARTEAALAPHRPSPAVPFIRMPYGAAAGDPRVRAAMASWHPGCVAVQWSLCAEEWTLTDLCRTPDRIHKVLGDAVRKLGRTAEWDRAIILMHDWPSVPADGSAPKPLSAAFCAALLEDYLVMAASMGLVPVLLSAP